MKLNSSTGQACATVLLMTKSGPSVTAKSVKKKIRMKKELVTDSANVSFVASDLQHTVVSHISSSVVFLQGIKKVFWSKKENRHFFGYQLFYPPFHIVL